MNLIFWTQGDVNQHKHKKTTINANWDQNGAWMNHSQFTFTKHIMVGTLEE
jgi:hypothetical protein